ncbi:MAG: hypothetical protein WCL04_08590 [Verrucomicrobiota bacterium]
MKTSPIFGFALLIFSVAFAAEKAPVNERAPVVEKLPVEELYSGMLGTYGEATSDFPFYFLTTPDGSNVWSEAVAAKLNGKWDMNKKPPQFSARGHFYLFKATKLKIEAAGEVAVTIDAMGYELSNYNKRNGAEVDFSAGLHTIQLKVGNNGGQLRHCGIWITEVPGGTAVPIFVTKPEVDEFVGKYPKSAMEVSDWDAKKSKIDLTPKKMPADTPPSGRR